MYIHLQSKLINPVATKKPPRLGSKEEVVLDTDKGVT